MVTKQGHPARLKEPVYTAEFASRKCLVRTPRLRFPDQRHTIITELAEVVMELTIQWKGTTSQCTPSPRVLGIT